MRNHLTTTELNNYLEQALPPHELLAADAHIEECDRCRRSLSKADLVENAIDEIIQDFHAVEASEADHLSSHQLTNYVRDDLNAFNRKVAFRHLKNCPSCAEELQDLLGLKGEIEVHAPPTRASHQTTLLDNLSAPFIRVSRLFAERQSVAVGILVLIGCVLLVLMLNYLPKSKRTSGQLVITPSTPAIQTTTGTPNLTPQSDIPSQAQVSGDNLTETPAVKSVGRGVAPKDLKKVANSPEMSTGTSRVLLSLIDGGRRITLYDVGEIEGLQMFSSGLRKEVRKALITQRLSTPPVISGLRGSPLRLLDGSSPQQTFGVIGPNGAVILSDRPTLRWDELSGATGYMVVVVDSQLNSVASSEMLTTTHWTVPAPLPRGGVYRWQVTAIKDGKAVRAPKPPAPEAKFKILESQKVLELNKLERSGANSHLLLGVAYAREGLLEEAERELQSLVKDNPRSAVAKKLLISLRAGEK